MKKCIALLLAILFIFTLSGCKEEPILPPESDNISDIKLYIDKSYTGENCLLYAIYTVSATDKEIEFFYYTQGKSSVGSGAVVTLNSLNSYSDLFSANETLNKPFEITTLKSPSEGQVIAVGESHEFISAFFVSKNDIKNGGSLVLNIRATNRFNEKEEINLDTISYIDSALSLARTISPDGLTKEEKAAAEEIEKIDKELEEKIEEALDGCWEYTKDNIKTEMLFEKGKYTETKTEKDKKPKTTAKGSYSIRKKVILVTLKNGNELRIPYTYSDDVLKVDAPKSE